jgi:hypothetical protein
MLNISPLVSSTIRLCAKTTKSIPKPLAISICWFLFCIIVLVNLTWAFEIVRFSSSGPTP